MPQTAASRKANLIDVVYLALAARAGWRPRRTNRRYSAGSVTKCVVAPDGTADQRVVLTPTRQAQGARRGAQKRRRLIADASRRRNRA